jgi:iron complex outermembrane receptor protein
VELESIWQATDSLRFLLNYSYLDTKLEDGGCYEDALDAVTIGPRPCLTSGGRAGQAVDGNRVPGSPKNKVAFNTLYTIDFAPGSLILSGSWTWRDTTYSSIFNRTEWLAPSYDQTDFRVTWQEAQNRYSVIAYVRNTFDDEGFDAVSASSTASGITRNLSLTPPRQYGVELQYRFGKK